MQHLISAGPGHNPVSVSPVQVMAVMLMQTPAVPSESSQAVPTQSLEDSCVVSSEDEAEASVGDEDEDSTGEDDVVAVAVQHLTLEGPGQWPDSLSPVQGVAVRFTQVPAVPLDNSHGNPTPWRVPSEVHC